MKFQCFRSSWFVIKHCTQIYAHSCLKRFSNHGIHVLFKYVCLLNILQTDVIGLRDVKRERVVAPK